jgi:aminoglycoside phosphotransferase (APT) family kinase protein
MSAGLVPDLETVAAALSAAPGEPSLVEQEPNWYGDGRSQILTCRLPDGTDFRLFCKYDKPGEQEIAYEARVYRELLDSLEGDSVLRYYGSHVDEESGRGLLIVEYLEGRDDLRDGLRQTDTLVRGAGWLGRFHRAMDERFGSSPPAFLRRNEADRYVGLACHVLETDAVPPDWLAPLAERLGDFLAPLLETRAVVVHDDFHLTNLLVRSGRFCVVDWESARTDLGEADLVYLVHGWPDEIVELCVRDYRDARWPGGAPAGFDTSLATAWLCLWLYKLAEEELERDDYERTLGHLHVAAERLGLV